MARIVNIDCEPPLNFTIDAEKVQEFTKLIKNELQKNYLPYLTIYYSKIQRVSSCQLSTEESIRIKIQRHLWKNRIGKIGKLYS